MKKVILLSIAAGVALSAIAQESVPTHTHYVDPNKPKFAADSLLAPWVIDINLLGGALVQNMTTANTAGNYLNGVNMNTGNLKFTNGVSLGFDGQLGYFFGKKHNWGIGAGIMYLYQQGDATLDAYHVEFQSTDSRGQTFRQLITADQPIQEALQITNINIPLVAKYKKRFSQRLGFTADAGLLFNVQERSAYKTNGSFDYEAIYQYSEGTYVYDAASTPSANDILYTKAQLSKTYGGDVTSYFNMLHSDGYNVGLGVKPNSDNGAVSYTTGSVGFILRPALNVFLSDNVALNFGLYYMYQSFSNSVKSGYQVTNKVGDYSSLLNSVSSVGNQSYGVNVGVRFLFGRRAPMIADEDAYGPTMCGLSDGSIAINGLHPDKDVTVNYNKNGAAQKAYTGTVDTNGTVTLNGLGAGSYDNIIVTMHKRTATSMPVTIINPPFNITFESSTNPTDYGKCDGAISFNVPRPGQSVTINYNLNGAAQPPFTGVISSSNRIVLNNLCGGNYTGITATMGACSANGVDVTLVTPPAPPPPPPPPPAPPAITVSTPILFEVNKTIIREDSHPVLELAVDKLNADKESIVIVNGYTDITGKPAYNKALSLRRADAVKKELVKMGISAKRIKVVGHGENDPAASNDTPEGMAQNRRAVMHLSVGE